MKKTLYLSALTVLAASVAMPAMAEDTLTISVYAFAQDEYKAALYDPFEAICGCKLVVETGNSVERMAKIEANAANPVVDVAVIAAPDALALARKNLIADLDVSKIASYDALYPAAQDPIGDHKALGYTFYATSIVYRSDLLKIESWGDLLGAAVKGRVALPNITGTQGPLALDMLNRAAGRSGVDFTQTIDDIAAHADDIVTFYSRSSELAQLMNQEEVIAAPVGRFAWASFAKSELPFAWAEPKEGQAGGMNVIVMTKGNGNEALAYKFIDYWLSDEVQTRVAEAQIDSPANKNVVVSDEVAVGLTYGADLINSLQILSPADIIDNREAWVEQWNTKVVN